MFTIAICDDEVKTVQKITGLIKEYTRVFTRAELSSTEFSGSGALLSALSAGAQFDIFILDIYIDEMTGVELAKHIRAANNKAAILFLTISPEHAVDAFSVEAVHYLLKPIVTGELFSALDRCLERLAVCPEKPSLTLKTTEGAESILIENILYIESMRQYQKIIQRSHSSTVRETLSGLYGLLREDGAFIMPHRAFIVNMRHIHRLTTAEILMKNGDKIPLPRGEYRNTKKLFLEYCFREGLPPSEL